MGRQAVIYDFPLMSDPIRQGDIFVGVPRIDISLEKMLIIEQNGEREVTWLELAKLNVPAKIIVPVRPVTAIVASQD